MANGKWTKLTIKKKSEFLDALRDTGNITIACRACNISRQAAYDARINDPDFADRWDDAIHHATEILEYECRRRALEGFLEPVYYAGKQVGTIRKFSDTLAIFLLKAARPQKYRDNVSIDVNANVEKLVKIINETCPEKASEIRRRIQEDFLDESYN